jgi:hypothetical protein
VLLEAFLRVVFVWIEVKPSEIGGETLILDLDHPERKPNFKTARKAVAPSWLDKEPRRNALVVKVTRRIEMDSLPMVALDKAGLVLVETGYAVETFIDRQKLDDLILC